MSESKINPAVAGGLLSIEEACDFSKLGRSTLYKEMDAGNLSYCKIGRRRMIPKNAIIDWLANAMIGTTQQKSEA